MLQGRQLSDSRMQINSLDGLRGLAILIVFCSHASNAGMHLFPWIDLSAIGKYGVFLFFVLSSFLLTYPFLAKGEKAFTKDFLINYFIRRFFRIYPLYFLYLLTKLIATMVVFKAMSIARPIDSPFTLTFQEFINHLLLLQGKGVTWSIMVEFRFYFLLPLIAFCFSTILKKKLIPSFLFTIAMIAIVQLFWPQSEILRNDDRLGPYLPLFLMGSFLALCHYRWKSNTWSNSKYAPVALEIAGAAAMVAVLALIPSVFTFLTGNHEHSADLHKQLIPFGILWSILLFASINGYGLIRRIFETWPLRQVGFISFSIYLLHPALVGVTERFYHGTHGSILGWALLLITISVSYVTFYVIEKPSSRIRYQPRDKYTNRLPVTAE
jgi:peptidoglycan/LPS O-acetylase OafA/YrhL